MRRANRPTFSKPSRIQSKRFRRQKRLIGFRGFRRKARRQFRRRDADFPLRLENPLTRSLARKPVKYTRSIILRGYLARLPSFPKFRHGVCGFRRHGGNNPKILRVVRQVLEPNRRARKPRPNQTLLVGRPVWRREFLPLNAQSPNDFSMIPHGRAHRNENRNFPKLQPVIVSLPLRRARPSADGGRLLRLC